MELFEQIRREHEFGGQSIRALSEQFGVHRRTVRQALENALPPERKVTARARPKWDAVQSFIDSVLEADRQAPRKQRHTSRRIYERIQQELPEVEIAERTVRQYVQRRKVALGLTVREVTVPQEYRLGEEAQVDWYEAVIELDGQAHKMQIFTMRSMASGAAFHRAYSHATQQAFLEAHEYAFGYFGGVFSRLRYDNLGSAVKRILRGSRREETTRFVAFRSHWRFEASFCTPGKGNEKGGVEGEVGRFRRKHLVPVPMLADLRAFNDYLHTACVEDHKRRIGERTLTVGEVMAQEQSHLLPLQEGFELAEASFCVVDGKSCVQVRTNFYSVPLRVGTRCQVKVLPATVEVWHQGKQVAQHERCYSRRQQVLDLEHYLDVLIRKPGALAGSRPLAQWRRSGRWNEAHDQLWASLQQRHGRSEGTRLMIEVLQLGRQNGYDCLNQAIEQALHFGTHDAAAIRYLLTAPHIASMAQIPLENALGEEKPAIGDLSNVQLSATLQRHYERPLPLLDGYDLLLTSHRTTKEVGS